MQMGVKPYKIFPYRFSKNISQRELKVIFVIDREMHWKEANWLV
jgi:hypothetical protein